MRHSKIDPRRFLERQQLGSCLADACTHMRSQSPWLLSAALGRWGFPVRSGFSREDPLGPETYIRQRVYCDFQTTASHSLGKMVKNASIIRKKI